MAGAGFKTFNTGDVLTASDVNTYLMQQTVMVFADSSARSTALGANVAEGMISYLKDTNAVERYDGSSWAAINDGDITEVTAGTGISGGGTAGAVTITNSMATAIDAKGDLIVGTGADTFSRLAVGSNGFVVQANSGETTGLKWVASGRYLLASGSLSGSTLDLTSISANYTHLEVILRNYYGSQDQQINATINNDSGANQYGSNNGSVGNPTYNASSFTPVFSYDSTDQNNLSIIRYYDYAGSAHKLVQTFMNSTDNTNSQRYIGLYHTTIYKSTSAINRLTFTTSAGTWSGGTYELWGVK